jgi:hypothetical protein
MIKSLPAAAAATALAALIAFTPAQAVVSITSTGAAYTQDFDTLAGAGTNVAWANNSTLPGWYLFISTGAAAPSYNADGGSSNAGAFRSFGTTGSSERALGGLASGGTYWGSPASGAVAGYIAVGFANDTGAALAGFSIGFAGEQWRDGGATAPAPQTMSLQYGFGASLAAVSGWVSPGGSLDWSSPVFTNTAGGAAVDGNGAGRVAGRGGSIAVPWAAGDTLWLRWTERNDAGNDHGLAIDDFAFAVTPVPEPGIGAMLLAGMAVVGLLSRRRA